MEEVVIYLIISFFIGIVIGGIISYFYIKSKSVARTEFNTLKEEFIKNNSILIAEQENNTILKEQVEFKDKKIEELNNELNVKSQDISTLRAEKKALNDKFEQKEEDFGNLSNKLLEESKKIEELNNELNVKSQNISTLRAENKAAEDKLLKQKEDFINLQKKAELQFEKIANQILEEKSKNFTSLNENELKKILHPFNDNLKDFKKTVQDVYEKEGQERFSLGKKVLELQSLNQQISVDAKNLTHALKGDSKVQGNWGEMILENILQESGLRKESEYITQKTLRDSNNIALKTESGNKMIPDAIIKYPDSREVIVDSKVSLTAYAKIFNEEDEKNKQQNLKDHIASIKKHIDELSKKSYDDYDKTLDFVIMFIPIESAYITAMKEDPTLWQYAFKKRILVLSPITFITTLKLISDLWKREIQSQNAMKIAKQGANLYDKFCGFVDNLNNVKKNLNSANKSFDEAYKQLSTGNDNLVRQTEKLKELGIKTKKNIPQGLIDESMQIINEKNQKILE